MKFPVNEQWLVDPSTDKGVNLLSVRNISFLKKKYATLAAKNVRLFDNTDEADFEFPVSFYTEPTSGSIEKVYCSDDDPYDISLNTSLSISKDTSGTPPSGSLDGSGVIFNGEWAVTESNNIHTNDGSTWTDRSVTLSSGVRHPLAVFKNRNNLAAGNGNQVKQFNPDFSEDQNLTLPSDIEVTGLAYNRNLLAIIGAAGPNDGYLFIWDGATSSANFGYPLNSQRGICVVAYKDTFVCLTGAGEGLYWTGSGLDRLFAFPSYYQTYDFAEMRSSNRTIAHDTAMLVNKQRIFMNVHVTNDSANEEPERYDPLQPSGVWVYDPAVGLHHQNSHTGAKVIERNATQANIDTSTDTITVTTGVPETGTPVIMAGSSFDLEPIKQRVTYYTIKVSDTEFQLASTIENATAGTQIDITSAEASGNWDFVFFPASDFGQLRLDQVGGAISVVANQTTSSTSTSLATQIVYGAEDVEDQTITGGIDCICAACPYGENRGVIVTQKLFAPENTAKWQKLITKVRGMDTGLDKILVKARTVEDVNTPIHSFNTTNGQATWTSQTTFTTPTDLTDVKTAFDNDEFYEVELIKGAGSGYTGHISAMSESSGTWTVTLDETIKHVSSSNTSHFVIENWQKLNTTNGSDSPDQNADKNFAEFVFGDQFGDSKWLQLKFELRGNQVALEEYELIFDNHNLAT